MAESKEVKASLYSMRLLRRDEHGNVKADSIVNQLAIAQTETYNFTIQALFDDFVGRKLPKDIMLEIYHHRDATQTSGCPFGLVTILERQGYESPRNNTWFEYDHYGEKPSPRKFLIERNEDIFRLIVAIWNESKASMLDMEFSDNAKHIVDDYNRRDSLYKTREWWM